MVVGQGEKRRKWLAVDLAIVLATVGLTWGCGDSDDNEDAVPDGIVSVELSHDSTQDVTVWRPDADGSWPVIYALHGQPGSRSDMELLGTRLAREGYVVFAADMRVSDDAVPEETEQDVECGYRLVQNAAMDHGGDLDQPVTMIGFSFGASTALFSAVHHDVYGPAGTYDECFSGVPRPELVVAIAGCYYQTPGDEPTGGFSTWDTTTESLDVALVSGEEDALCEPWQSEQAANELAKAGYDTEHVKISEGTHWNIINPEEAAGEATAVVILDAIASQQS
jgi:dienelactone hydrolase